ncbi:glycosyltransferase family 25 protein [Polycladidibacter hongkongensis]|uniref:glycosyltransferase family 25 protein n=1 Tax=Polycladidibacter hongkongensis TaxID=1647556 RepID=UPI000829C8AF|nr:glycosyltransferase family 25 protein [Pseudovibrio hongkongensis]
MKIRYFAINVEANTHRRERILEQAAQFDIPLQIHRAITPATLDKVPNTYQHKKAIRHWGRRLMPTELACGLSHLQLWRNLLEDQEADAYVILEDDLEIKTDIKAIIAQCPLEKTGFIKLSGQHQRPMRKQQELSGDYDLYKLAYGPLDAGCYLVTKAAAEKLVCYCASMHMAVDVLMDRSYIHGADVFAVIPYPTRTRQCHDPSNPLYTDIGLRNYKHEPGKSTFDKYRTRLLRLVSSVLKRYAELKLKIGY